MAVDVGIKLIAEIMDHAPKMTASQWRALIILAEDANDGTRLTYSPVEGKKITGRVGLSVEAWANLRTALVRKGLLEIAVPGVKGRAAKYRFPAYSAMPHRSDEAFAPEPEVDLHQSDEESGPMPHRSDEESAECFIGSMTPTPRSTYSSEEPSPRPVGAIASLSPSVPRATVNIGREDITTWAMREYDATAEELDAAWEFAKENGMSSRRAWLKSCPDDVAEQLCETREMWAAQAAYEARQPMPECGDCARPMHGAGGPLCRDCRDAVG